MSQFLEYIKMAFFNILSNKVRSLLTMLGIIIGIVGIILISVNYPIYKKLINMGKKKYAADIIRLASEISEEK